MPKILINEIDRTSAGTPSDYSNNSVLICGFAQRSNEEIIAAAAADPKGGYILPDENGIFEFYSQNDFKKTIGEVSPFLNDDEHIPEHYGNQMAYELLGQGYPSVIYISLGKVPSTAAEVIEVLRTISADDANNTDIWGIFKDKASYDFRFVTHGLLNSCDDHDTEATKNAWDVAEENYSIAMSGLAAAEERLEEAQATLEQAQEANEILKGQEGYDEESAEAKAATKKEADAEKEVAAVAKIVADAEKAVSSARTTADRAEEAHAHASIECFTASNFNNANEAIINLALYTQDEEYEAKPDTGRGDCVALIEVDESRYRGKSGRPEQNILEAVELMSSSVPEAAGPYCACTVPSVVYKMDANENFGGNKKFPGAFHYLVCYKRMIDANFAEWYAAAGYNRGVSSYTIDHTTVKLGEIAIQALEPRYKRSAPYNYKMPFAVNVIANFRGSYYLWGNRTCALLDEYAGGGDLTAHHFLNIRHLCTTIKKQLYVSCRRFTFDPNSDVLWINFKNSIIPTLERMKADQGIREYKIEKVYTDKKATLRAKIRIVPIEAVEDFVLEVSLEDSLGETAVAITE